MTLNDVDPDVDPFTDTFTPTTTVQPGTSLSMTLNDVDPDVDPFTDTFTATSVPWPAPPGSLAVGRSLQRLRDTVDALDDAMPLDQRRGGRAEILLMVSLKKTNKDEPVMRSSDVEDLTLGQNLRSEDAGLVGRYLAVGAFIDPGTGSAHSPVMTPNQMRTVMELQGMLRTDGKPVRIAAVVSHLWGPAAQNRKHVVDAVWSTMNWDNGTLSQRLAEAVVEIADDLKRHRMPVDAKVIAGLIWRDDRALDYQAVIVEAILQRQRSGFLAINLSQTPDSETPVTALKRFRAQVSKPVEQLAAGATSSAWLVHFVHDVLAETNKRGAPLTVREITARWPGSQRDQELHVLAVLQATGLPYRATDADGAVASGTPAEMIALLAAIRDRWKAGQPLDVQLLSQTFPEAGPDLLKQAAGWLHGALLLRLSQPFAQALSDAVHALTQGGLAPDDNLVGATLMRSARPTAFQRATYQHWAQLLTLPTRTTAPIPTNNPTPLSTRNINPTLAPTSGPTRTTNPPRSTNPTPAPSAHRTHTTAPTRTTNPNPTPTTGPTRTTNPTPTTGPTRTTNPTPTTGPTRTTNPNPTPTPAPTAVSSTGPVAQYASWLRGALEDVPPENAPVGDVLAFIVHYVLRRSQGNSPITAAELVARLRSPGHVVGAAERGLMLGVLQATGLPHMLHEDDPAGPGTPAEMDAVLTAVRLAKAANRPVERYVDRLALVRGILPGASDALLTQALGWAMGAQLPYAPGRVRLLVNAAQDLQSTGTALPVISAKLLNSPQPTAFHKAALNHLLSPTPSRASDTSSSTSSGTRPTPRGTELEMTIDDIDLNVNTLTHTSAARSVIVTTGADVPWPQLPAPLTVGRSLKRLRAMADGYTYKENERPTTNHGRLRAALLISLIRNANDDALKRGDVLAHLAHGSSPFSAMPRLLGTLRAVGIHIYESSKSSSALTPLQMGQVLARWSQGEEAPLDVAKDVWGGAKPLGGHASKMTFRSYVVAGVWETMDWNDGDVFQALADAVVEVARDLERAELPMTAEIVARLIWRDHRAVDYQAAVVQSILQARGVL
ncbi:hypothetical protein [Streptomyces sp. NPDC056632]|uniref:hypothetical protein n=1 Tax=Streptomyces sp. NPDC056632 TaxID=3345884 RepID=UPI0036BD6645